MSFPIDFRPEAEQDLQEACDWYKTRATALDEDFLDQVEKALEQVSQYPQSSSVVHRDICRYHLERFPHSILYIVELRGIVVLAVYYGRRDSVGWKERR